MDPHSDHTAMIGMLRRRLFQQLHYDVPRLVAATSNRQCCRRRLDIHKATPTLTIRKFSASFPTKDDRDPEDEESYEYRQRSALGRNSNPNYHHSVVCCGCCRIKPLPLLFTTRAATATTTTTTARCFATSTANNNNNSSNNNNSKNKKAKKLSTIEARPPGEAPVETKFPLPDAVKERELGTLISHVQDLYRQGNYRAAVPVATELLSETTNHFGRNHPATASAHCNLGLVHKSLGDYALAHEHYQQATVIYRNVLGPHHASYAACLHNTALLFQSQIHLDPNLSATDRWNLLDQAIGLLKEAWNVRTSELGRAHPHTVATQSSWGMLVATQILHHYKVVTTTNSNNTSGGGGGAATPQQRVYRSLLASSSNSSSSSSTASEKDPQWSADTWEAANTHLRQALQTALDNPRGPQLPSRKKGPRRKSKQQQKTPKDDIAQPVLETLSSANAAMNLAIFLKARAVVLQGDTNDENNNSDEISANDDPTANDAESDSSVEQSDPPLPLPSLSNAAVDTDPQALLLEAHGWYQRVLTLRRQLLPKGHALIYATLHSLAECLDSLQRPEEAQAIRQEIVDTYDPPEDDAAKDAGETTPKVTTYSAGESPVQGDRKK